ncbi:anti-sigma factor family protein [Streptomyces sp. NPDC054838]
MSPTTGTTGTIRHPDVAEISDLSEGLLSPARTAAVRSHLGDCPLCADVLASLEEIRALLGTLPGPSRMPSDIAGRIDAALAAEALLDSTSRRAEPAPAVPDRDDVSRETPSPAPARPAGHPAGPTGPGRRRARRRIAVLAGLAGASACVLGLFLSGALGASSSHDTAARTGISAAPSPHPTDGSYTSQGLQGSVQNLLASGSKAQSKPEERNNTYGMQNASPKTDPKTDPNVAPNAVPGDRQAPFVPPCVQQATGRPDAPLAAEQGSYQGTDVFLVVLPHPGDTARVDAYVVASDCANSPSTAPAKPLLTGTYARP